MLPAERLLFFSPVLGLEPRTASAISPLPVPSTCVFPPDLPCGQLLHFLQRNIIIVAGILAAIFGLMALLVFVLTSSMRRRQPP